MGIYYVARHKYHVDAMYPIWEGTGGEWIFVHREVHGYKGLEHSKKKFSDLTEKDLVIANCPLPEASSAKYKFVRLELMQHSPGQRTNMRERKCGMIDYGIVTTDSNWDLDYDLSPTYKRMRDEGRIFQAGAWFKKYYLDRMESKSDGNTILLAPASSNTAGGFLNVVGEQIIEKLLSEGYKVILMPHELDVYNLPGRGVIERLRERMANGELEGLELLDSKNTGIDKIEYAFTKSDICISDFSGTSYEFAYLNKPVIHLKNTSKDRWNPKYKHGNYHHTVGPLVDFEKCNFLPTVQFAMTAPEEFIQVSNEEWDRLEALHDTVGLREVDPITPSIKIILDCYDRLQQGNLPKKDY
ncbi:CDP-glycerol:poly(glycerophosphate) glycerophosphotransferase [Bacillus phage SP-15]|uniref:CDP-glycerol:poly(Glycerophosphate) glycerophosphotransferase n=1 Tax=Bacillus phage SP-15 TaxID=1792032 RepID=A0A127AW81_9CAUD|nr:CDP-glycerol:poly(glycerophosphate) glycerophosphotransferase [Bacillus phage SP-15]AMM44949.1 CDP-glycerol:poly(glycerophosphate) glycerophosphotransferase [Bacillus phage SP-15]